MRLHLAPFFGEKKAHDITTADVQSFILARQEKGASNGEINRELIILKRMFNLALQAEKITRKPHIPHLEEDNVRQGFFEPWDFVAVLTKLPECLRPPFTFAYHTGWRVLSEVLPLTWQQVDLVHFQETFWGIISPYEMKKSYQHSHFSEVIPKDLS